MRKWKEVKEIGEKTRGGKLPSTGGATKGQLQEIRLFPRKKSSLFQRGSEKGTKSVSPSPRTSRSKLKEEEKINRNRSKLPPYECTDITSKLGSSSQGEDKKKKEGWEKRGVGSGGKKKSTRRGEKGKNEGGKGGGERDSKIRKLGRKELRIRNKEKIDPYGKEERSKKPREGGRHGEGTGRKGTPYREEQEGKELKRSDLWGGRGPE